MRLEDEGLLHYAKTFVKKKLKSWNKNSFGRISENENRLWSEL